MSNATRWRKKPVTVDAVRNEGEWAPILAWLDRTGYTVPLLGKPAITRSQDGSLSIETLEGTMRADVGDWVIRGVQGEFYLCKPVVFAATYEPAVGEAEDPGRVAIEAQPSPIGDVGATAYEAYRAKADGKSLVSGEPIPAWPELPQAVKDAWTAGGWAIAADVVAQVWAAERERDEVVADRDDYQNRLKATDRAYSGAMRQRDEARAELDRALKLTEALQRVLTSWARGMYSARINCVRGDVKAAIETLAEGLDGYDGTEWDGKETGTQWWERTKAEEVTP